MRQWRPEERDLDPASLYADVRWGGPGGGLAMGMVVGLDGGVTIKGTSGALGGDGDKTAFRALRAAADVIMVGAGTVLAENYGPPTRRPDAVVARRLRGQADLPVIAIVTGSLSVEPGHRVFEDVDRPPLFLTSRAAPAERRDALAAAGADVRSFGEQSVDLRAAVADLHQRGQRLVLCEGGPSLNTAVLRAGLVDEIFVTLAPTVTGSDRHLVTEALEVPVQLELLGATAAGSELLLRYGVSR